MRTILAKMQDGSPITICHEDLGDKISPGAWRSNFWLIEKKKLVPAIIPNRQGAVTGNERFAFDMATLAAQGVDTESFQEGGLGIVAPPNARRAG